MFSWFKNRSRHRLLKAQFPAEWQSIIDKNVGFVKRLSPADQQKLRELILVFVDEKHWEGCGGLTMTDEIKVTVAAGACTLLLGIPHDFYSNVTSILVYPSTVLSPEHEPGFFELPSISEGPMPVYGEAHERGPVILVWDEVLHSARHPDQGFNLVYHEFAHKLDMLDGTADGTPTLANHEEYREWVRNCSREFKQLRERADAGRKTFLDSYGAVNEAEFFAVATEHFFEQGRLLQKHHPELYAVLSRFYGQDPAALA